MIFWKNFDYFSIFVLKEEKMETLNKPKLKAKQNEAIMKEPIKKYSYWTAVIAILIFLLLALAGKKKDFLVSTDQGMKLAPWRQKKLQKDLQNFDEAEQYVLIAMVEGEYPCYHCEGQATIYLKVGEIWKYGVTKIGKDKRYSNAPIDPRLRYRVEYKGDIGTCLRLEKIKIYQYAELLENIQRVQPLIRPPGNKNDS